MNVPEFVFGIILTLAVEGVAFIAVCVKLVLNDKKGRKKDAKETPVPTGTYNNGGKWYDGTS